MKTGVQDLLVCTIGLSGQCTTMPLIHLMQQLRIVLELRERSCVEYVRLNLCISTKHGHVYRSMYCEC
jgi:hypothetical protein